MLLTIVTLRSSLLSLGEGQSRAAASSEASAMVTGVCIRGHGVRWLRTKDEREVSEIPAVFRATTLTYLTLFSMRSQ